MPGRNTPPAFIARPSILRTTPSGSPRASARSKSSRRHRSRRGRALSRADRLNESSADRRSATFPPARWRCLPSLSTSRRDLLRLALLLVRLPELDATAFLHVVARVHRQLADDV